MFITIVTKCYYTCDLYYICDQLLHLCLQQHLLNKLEAIISIDKLCRDLTKENKNEELKMTLTTNSCDICKYFQQ